ncbi:MAG: TRAP transporter small permease [Betaproteobacteria bacterium]|nr:TRAP transporter small permease [Betaproteobacteria bacterium]MBK8742413.1 TRAP transporter small permease [Betaproteobacteria bacterium]
MQVESLQVSGGALTALSHRLNQVCRVLTGLLLAGIVLSNAAEVVLRTAFATTLSWIFEINLLCATWIYFIGVCQVYYKKGDISVDVLPRVLPPGGRLVWSWVVDIVCIGTFVVIGWYGIQLVQLQWPFKTPGVGLPSASYSAPVVIGAAIMIIHVCAQRLRDLARL